MPTLSGTYDRLLRLVRRVSPLLEHGSSKLAVGLRGRVRAESVLEEWGRVHRDEERALVWMHAPSVGEGLQARAALDALLEKSPDLQAAYTFFSPSAEAFAQRMPVDVAGYLPWDVRSQMEGVLAALSPDLVSFTKTEVWPGLTGAAVARGTPVTLSAATLPPDAGRLKGPAPRLLRGTFASLSRVLAISQDDGERFLRLGVEEERVEVTGDPGIDSAWRRARGARPEASYLSPFHADPRPTLVAGSTWEPDEAILVPALATVREGFPELRAIIAPHEPGESHLARLEGELQKSGMRTVRLAEVEAGGGAGDADAVIVDRVGVLAHLYTVGTVAYVGGGFHRHGLHSVLEPAAAGLPVVFGPRHGNARSAAELIAVGGARKAADGREMVRVLSGWLRDRRLLEETGGRAEGYIEGHRGAAGRTARILERYLTHSSDGAKR